MELTRIRKIISKSQTNEESVAVYLWLSSHPHDDVWRFVYRSFYRLDNAGLSDKFKKKYFQLLEKKETNLKKILQRLHEYENIKGQKTYQLSFASKLLHTNDRSSPIYDSLVAKILKLPTRRSGIEWCCETYDTLKERYQELLGDKEIKQQVDKFKKEHGARISDVKALDFLLWSAGKQKPKRTKHTR